MIWRAASGAVVRLPADAAASVSRPDGRPGVLRDVGGDPTGEDDRHRHRGALELGVQRPGEEHDGLARAVDGLARDRRQGTHARDVDDGGSRARPQLRQERLGRVHHAPEVHGHDLPRCGCTPGRRS